MPDWEMDEPGAEWISSTLSASHHYHRRLGGYLRVLLGFHQQKRCGCMRSGPGRRRVRAQAGQGGERDRREGERTYISVIQCWWVGECWGMFTSAWERPWLGLGGLKVLL
jgi:hypothetical protein